MFALRRLCVSAVWCHACFSPKDPVMDMYTCWLAPIKPTLPVTNDCWDVFTPSRWASEWAAIRKTRCCDFEATYFWLCLSPRRRQRQWRWTTQWLPPLIWGRKEINKSPNSSFILDLTFFLFVGWFCLAKFTPGITINLKLNSGAGMKDMYTDKSTITKAKQTNASAVISERKSLRMVTSISSWVCLCA